MPGVIDLIAPYVYRAVNVFPLQLQAAKTQIFFKQILKQICTNHLLQILAQLDRQMVDISN